MPGYRIDQRRSHPLQGMAIDLPLADHVHRFDAGGGRSHRIAELTGDINM